MHSLCMLVLGTFTPHCAWSSGRLLRHSSDVLNGSKCHSILFICKKRKIFCLFLLFHPMAVWVSVIALAGTSSTPTHYRFLWLWVVQFFRTLLSSGRAPISKTGQYAPSSCESISGALQISCMDALRSLSNGFVQNHQATFFVHEFL